MGEVMSLAWAEKVRQLLDANPEFRKDARALTGTIYLYDQHGGVSFRFDRGVVLAVQSGPDVRGSQCRLGGSREAWQRALGGEADIHQATDARVGELTLDGDLFFFAGNAKAFMRLWDALKRTAAE